MPTRAGLWVLAGAVAVLVVGRVLGLVELYVLGSAGLVLVGVATAWIRRPIADLRVDRIVVGPAGEAQSTAPADFS